MNIKIECNREIAIDSPDHLHPAGTKRDNSINLRFNDKLNRLFAREEGLLKILDVGCAGGGFVKSCFDDGNLAVGLEGSDYSKKVKRAEWRTIPEYLFTCDITKDFKLFNDNNPMKFDVITSWEVFEHIKEEDLKNLISNLMKHLDKNGLLIFSISTNTSNMGGVELHQTVKPEVWWRNKFRDFGLTIRDDLKIWFNKNFVRGESRKYEGSFNIILSSKNNNISPPIRSWKLKLGEWWERSKFRKFLETIVLGEIRY